MLKVGRNDDKDGARYLNATNAKPDNRWNLDNEVVVALRNLLHFSPAFSWAGEFCL